MGLQFDRPALLGLLALLPVLWFLLRLRAERRARDLQRARGSRPMRHRPGTAGRSRIMMAIVISAAACGVVGAAGIRTTTQAQAIERPKRDLVLVLDVSRSMLAADLPPSRLHEAVRQLRASFRPAPDENLGIVIFAGESMLACPLTMDPAAIEAVLRDVETPPIGGGSAIAAGLSRATASLPRDASHTQAILLVSDGEATDTSLADTLTFVRERGIPIHAVGVGTPEGAPVPAAPGQGLDVQRNEAGRPLMTQLVEESLRSIATESRGTFRRLEPGQSTIATVLNEIRTTAPPITPVPAYDDVINRLLFAAAALLLAVECVAALSASDSGAGQA